MARYIDADKMRDNAIRMGFHSTTMTISELIDLQPTAPVRENVRGEWDTFFKEDNGLKFKFHRCSICKRTKPMRIFSAEDFEFNFCPNCGADMRSQDVHGD